MVSRSGRASLDGHPLAGGVVWGCGSWMAVYELRGKRENFQSLLALRSLRSRGGSQRESVQLAASPGGRER